MICGGVAAKWAAGPTGRHPVCNRKIAVRFRGSPIFHQHKIRVGCALVSPDACKASAFGLCRFDSCSTHSAHYDSISDNGAIPGVSPRSLRHGPHFHSVVAVSLVRRRKTRKAAEYGLSGRIANACLLNGDKGSNPLPSAFGNLR